MTTTLFHTPDGHELTARLEGEAGARVVSLFDSHGRFMGSRTYGELMTEHCNGMFAPDGDVMGCRDVDLVLIDRDRMRALAVWAEEQVLGDAAIGEEE